MTMERWLGATEFALLAGVNRSVGSRILRAAYDGKFWRGVALTVRKKPGRGPRGLRLEVAASSLPTNLLQDLDNRRDTADTIPSGHNHGVIDQHAETCSTVNSEDTEQQPSPSKDVYLTETRLKRKEANLEKYAHLPQDKRRRAEARFHITQACNDFILQHSLSRHKGLELFVQEYLQGRFEVPREVREVVKSKLRARTLRRWIASEREHGLIGLVDDFGNKKGHGKLDAFPVVQELIIGMILNKTIIRSKIVYESIQTKYPDAARHFGAKTVERFITQWRKKHDQLYAKLTDPDRWKNQYKVAFGSQSESTTILNQLWSLDDTKADLLCTDGRYSAIFVIDIYSRRTKILIVKTADAVAVGTLFRSAILAWGAPQAILIDNGRVYCNVHIDGVLRSLEIEKLVCTPYASEEKGIVERVQGTFQRGLLELLPGFVGHNVYDRKRIEAKRAFGQRAGDPTETPGLRITGEKLQEFANYWCEKRYQHTPQSGLPINPDTKKHFTPFEMATAWRGSVRRVEERTLDVLLLMTGETRVVGKKGIQLDRARYIHADLVTFIGKQVMVHVDPDDLGKAIVYAAESHEFICIAESAARSGISLREKAVEASVAQKQYLSHARAAVKDARRAAKNDDPVRRIQQRDREAVANIAAFPHRSIAHTTSGIEMANEAAIALQESKKQPQRKSTQAQARTNEIDVEVISLTSLRIRLYRTMGRALGDHELRCLERWFPNGAPEDQVGAIAQRLTAPTGPMPVPDEIRSTVSSGKES